jgi:hypothetical protein
LQYRRNAGAVASPVVSSGIYLDAVRPVLTVDSPANGLITNIPTVHIEGSVVDATSPVQVTVNGQRADGIVAGRYMFDAYSLTPGTNLIVIVATDTAGNSNTLTNLCILNTNGDVTPPSLLLDMPLDYQVSGGVTNYFNRTTFGADDLLRVHALASEAGVKTVFTVTNSIGAVQAYNGSISGTDIWARVTLSPGTNTLSWVVFDAAGNQAVSARTVIRDTNFLFQITSPPDLAVQNSNSVTVSGIASANFRAATMTVNGINATITDHGSNVTFATVSGVPADSDESGHLFQSMSDTIPGLSDSCRSEATLWVSHKGCPTGVKSFATVFVLIRSPSEGRRFPGSNRGASSRRLFGRAVSGGNGLSNSSSRSRRSLRVTDSPARPNRRACDCSNFNFHFPKEAFCLCASIRL